MDDPGCQGAYSFSLSHSKRFRLSETEYFDHKLPWAAPLNIRIEWWPDGRFEVEIADVGKRVLVHPSGALNKSGRSRPGGLVEAPEDSKGHWPGV
jgi:hypothetical protein